MPNPKAMISSTILDLPDHRQAVLDACLRQSHFPLMMEHLPAGSTAVQVSLRLVDEASVYIGIFGHRYGTIPDGEKVSITEMEYDRAVKRGITRLVFLMHEDHLIRVADVDHGEPALRLQDLKKHLLVNEVVNYFKSAEDLRAQVINSLSYCRSYYRKPHLGGLHFVNEIPKLPAAYIAHPYILLTGQGLVGRQAELNLLTDWVAQKKTAIYQTRVLSLVAIGGMGKSALTWTWFNKIAPQEMNPLAGRLWWSFYESDATFENFVLRALCYCQQSHPDEVQQIPAPDREKILLETLDRTPFLAVLDGLERIMVAYARMDAASMADDDLDEQAGNVVIRDTGLPDSSAESFTGRHRLRRAVDPRAGSFLRKLSQVRESRILISTRLYPAELQTEIGNEMRGSKAVFLDGLTDDDALSLWRSFGVSGSRDLLQRLFHSLNNYPLLIRTLAGEVAGFRRAPGNLDKWLEAHPDFNPFDLPLVQSKSHVLSFALRGLGGDARSVLLTLAAFRMPAAYDALAALLVGPPCPFASEDELDLALTDLEDRGLIGWDRSANRYDLHPVVRGVTWRGLGKVGRRIIYENLQSYFQSMPALETPPTNVDELAPAVELYNTLIGLGLYDEAYALYLKHINNSVFKLCLARQSTEWLAMLFPDGIENPPRLTPLKSQRDASSKLAYGFHYSGRPQIAMLLCERLVQLSDSTEVMSHRWGNFAGSLSRIGRLREAEVAARKALSLDLDNKNPLRLVKVGELLARRGDLITSGKLLRLALRRYEHLSKRDEFWEYAHVQMAQHALWAGQLDEAILLAERAWELSEQRPFERNVVDAATMQGLIAYHQKNFTRAEERFQNALTRTRLINYVTAEIDILNQLAELYRAWGEPARARETLDDVWEPIDRGPYFLGRAAALNVLAEIECDQGNREAAVQATMTAYRLAWCDGPPYTDFWQVERLQDVLARLGESPPEGLLACRESDYEPMPGIDPEILEES